MDNAGEGEGGPAGGSTWLRHGRSLPTLFAQVKHRSGKPPASPRKPRQAKTTCAAHQLSPRPSVPKSDYIRSQYFVFLQLYETSFAPNGTPCANVAHSPFCLRLQAVVIPVTWPGHSYRSKRKETVLC